MQKLRFNFLYLATEVAELKEVEAAVKQEHSMPFILPKK